MDCYEKEETKTFIGLNIINLYKNLPLLESPFSFARFASLNYSFLRKGDKQREKKATSHTFNGAHWPNSPVQER
jgi:hypothetical protein